MLSAQPSRARRALANLPAGLAAAAVLAAYVFFGSGGTWSFQRLRWYGTSFYASLGEGFLQGQLNVALEPEPRLKQLANPYDFELRKKLGIDYLWDVSYYGGKYYLYWTPLPVLLFYIPFRLVAGAYPPDALAGTVFSAWAFVMAVAFARRALAGRAPRVPFALWVLLLGVGNVVPFVLASVRTYEVSVATAMAMSATWAYALLRFMETGTARHAAWMGFWLALAIVSRPNLAVLLLITAAVVLARRQMRTAAATLIPLAAIGLITAWYNYARFGNPLELGVTYQLTGLDLRQHSVCSLCSFPEVLRWLNSAMHYVFWAPTFGSEFPFVNLSPSRLDPAVSYPGWEQVGGIAPVVPLILLGTFAAVLFALGKNARDTGIRAAMRIMAGGWLVLFGLSACWYVVARYSFDFLMLMAVATVVCVEAGIVALSNAGIRILPLRILVAALALWSIVLGVMLGFQGPEGAFRKANPALFELMSE